MAVAMAVDAPTPQHHLVLEIQVSSSSPAHPNLFYVPCFSTKTSLFFGDHSVASRSITS